MSKKNFIFILLFYFLALIQASFLSSFRFFDLIPNLIMVTVAILAFFERSKGYLSAPAVLGGGFFLDVFSRQFLGFYVLIMLVAYFSIKMILKRYVRA